MPYIKVRLHPSVLGYELGINVTTQMAGARDGVRIDQIHRGVKDASMIFSFLNMIPELKSVIMTFKELLAVHGMGDAYTGGLCSYCVVLLVTSFMQSVTQERMLPWLHFGPTRAPYLACLSFYASFDVGKNSVAIPSCDHKTFQISRAQTEAAALGSRRLFIADPQGGSLNMAASCYNFDSIQKLFHDTLMVNMAAFEHRTLEVS